MPASEIIMAILRGYAAKARQVQLRSSQFAAFVRQYAETHQQANAALSRFLTNTESALTPVLVQLAEEGMCVLEYEGDAIKSIILLPFLIEKLEAAYREIDQDADIPFPNEERLQLTAPPSILTVNIKTDFVRWLSARPKEVQVLRLSFPEDIASILITTDLLERRLLEYSIQKIRNYIAAGSNSGYILQRLKEVFTLKDQVLQTTLHEIVTRPGQVYQDLLKGNEFTFTFWAHLASIILKEYKAKTEKLAQEHGYCQSAYLIGLYNVYFKGLVQRDKDVEVALKAVERRLAAEPFFFTISDIHDFRDDKGVPLTKRCPADKLNQFLETKTKSVGGLLPEVMRLRTADKREYFIHKSALLRLALNKIFAASRRYRDAYSEEWFENLSNFEKTPVMMRDDLFLQDLEQRMRSEDPLLHALLSFELLYLTRKERAVDDEVNRRIDRILDVKQQSLIPLDLLLGVRRRDIFTEARLKLPLWKTIPVLKHLFRLMDRMSGGGKKPRAAKGEAHEGAVKVLSAGRARSVDGFAGADAVPDLEGDEEFAFHGAGGEAEAGDRSESRLQPASGGRDRAARGHAGSGAHPAGAGQGKGGSATSESSRATARARLVEYRKALADLAEHVVGSNKSIDARLKELAEKWNPLVAEKAKRNLIEDVNSFVRDQVRILKRSLLRTPPDLERINNLSRQIAENDVFEEIKRKDEFREYIKIYLIKHLGSVVTTK